MYRANNTPGIQAKMVNKMSMKKVPPRPSAMKTANGGKTTASFKDIIIIIINIC